jgi:hypothetical protein
LTWLNKCDNYFHGHRVLEDEKVWMVSLHHDGTSAEWCYQMERDFSMVPWLCFVDFINLRFGPPIRAQGWWRNTLGATSPCSRAATTSPHAPRLVCTQVAWANP